MSAFWVVFKRGSALCVEGPTEAAAKERAETIGPVHSIRTLPYPAEPRMDPPETYTENGVARAIPPFCFRPEQCAGRTACPQRYSCTE